MPLFNSDCMVPLVSSFNALQECNRHIEDMMIMFGDERMCFFL